MFCNDVSFNAYVSAFSDDPVKFREDLLNIARTTLSSKILMQYKDHFSNLAVDAVVRLKVRCSCLPTEMQFLRLEMVSWAPQS